MAAALFRVGRIGFGVFRIILTLPARACSSNPVEAQEERIPRWANTPLDQMILKASSVESLFKIFERKTLSVMQATNVVTALARLSMQDPIVCNAITKNETFNDVCRIIDKNVQNMNHITLLSTLKSLLNMGVPSDKYVIQSLETEVLWKIRKMSLRHIVLLLSYHLSFQQSELQRKVVAEALDKIQQRWFEILDPREIVALLKLCNYFRTDFIDKIEDRTIELLDKMPVEDQQKIFSILAKQKIRRTHFLRALAFHISKNQQKLSVKHMSNVVHAMSALNFPDIVLLQRISQDLLPEVGNIDNPSIVASFLTAFGQLKWRHTSLLEAMTEWFQKHFGQCRVQDFVSYILTLAHVNYLPMSSDGLLPMLLPRVTLESVGSDLVWVDFVWALAVLQKATKDQFATVLNHAFYKKLRELPAYQSSAAQRKLLNINAVATWEMPNYKCLLVTKDLIEDCLSLPAKGDQTFRNSVIDTLSNYFPKGKYLTCNKLVFGDTFVDAEFFVDKDCKPLSFEEYGTNAGEKNKQLPPGAQRMVLLVQDFKDFTLHNVHLNGQRSLIVRVLQKMGYVVVQIPYTEYSCQAPTVKRLQYLQQKILDACSETKSDVNVSHLKI